MCPYGACYNACAMVSNPFLSRAAADMVSVMQLCLLYAAYIYIYIYMLRIVQYFGLCQRGKGPSSGDLALLHNVHSLSA